MSWYTLSQVEDINRSFWEAGVFPLTYVGYLDLPGEEGDWLLRAYLYFETDSNREETSISLELTPVRIDSDNEVECRDRATRLDLTIDWGRALLKSKNPAHELLRLYQTA